MKFKDMFEVIGHSEQNKKISEVIFGNFEYDELEKKVKVIIFDNGTTEVVPLRGMKLSRKKKMRYSLSALKYIISVYHSGYDITGMNK